MLFTQEPSAACGHFQEWRGQCLFDYSCVGVGAVSTRGFVDSLQLPVTCKHVALAPRHTIEKQEKLMLTHSQQRMTSLIHHLGSCPSQVRPPHAGTLLKAHVSLTSAVRIQGCRLRRVNVLGVLRIGMMSAQLWIGYGWVAPIFFCHPCGAECHHRPPLPHAQPSGMLTCPCDVGPPSMYPVCWRPQRSSGLDLLYLNHGIRESFEHSSNQNPGI